MATTTVFKIGNTDFSGHVIAGTYNINSYDLYSERQTGSKKIRRKFLRTQIMGSFEMFFRTMAEYTAFLNKYNSAKSTELTVNCTVTPNNTNIETVVSAFLSFTPTRNRDGQWHDYMEPFTIELTEA